MYKAGLKRVFDFTAAFFGLILASPFIIITAIVLYFNNDGSVLFFQPRIGRRNKIFKVIKFKTMNDRKDANGNLLPDDVRLTKVGEKVRKLSLDELPQLVNVLKGEMSLIGPRPLLVEYLPLYNSVQLKRHNVRPGITGWAQVNGRNLLGWKKRFEFDVYYVDNLTFWFDIKIILTTVIKVFKSEGVSGNNTMTMEKFRGNEFL